jgi:hypothetical protein
MITNVVGCGVEDVNLGMKVSVVFLTPVKPQLLDDQLK